MPDRMTYARLGKIGFLVLRVAVGGYANHGMKANAGAMASADPDAYRAALQYLIDVLLLHHLTTLSDSPYHNLGYVGPKRPLN